MRAIRLLFPRLVLAGMLSICAAAVRAQDEKDKPAAEATSPASTRAGNILGPEGANILMISMAPAVQQELKLTEAQKTKLFDLSKESTQKGADLLRASFMNGGNNPQAMLAAWSKFRQENEKAVAKALDDKQNERLAQLVYRVEGPLSISRPELSAKLKVTQTQYKQIQNVVDAWKLSQRELIATTRQAAALGNFDQRQMEQLRKHAAGLRETASSEIGRVLNRKQKDDFNTLLGEPFDLAKIDPSLATASAITKPSATEKTNRTTKKAGRAKPDAGSKTEKDS